RIASGLFSASAASRAHWMTRACSSWVPCAKLMRMTSTPAAISARILSGAAVAGPTVATTLLRIRKRASSMGGNLAPHHRAADGRGQAPEAQEGGSVQFEWVLVPGDEVGRRAGREGAQEAGHAGGERRACGVGAQRVRGAEPFGGEPAVGRLAVQVLAGDGGEQAAPRVHGLDGGVGAEGENGAAVAERAERVGAAAALDAPVPLGRPPIGDQVTRL